MSPLKLLFVIVFVFYGFQASARICENVNVRNTVENIEKQLRGCTIVVGNVEIALIHRWFYDDPPYKLDVINITFPELTEITGFLLLFRVDGLTSIGTLFPNLTVIRGDTLLVDYALVIYYLPDLKEIGLYNLRHIGRGSTRIEKCPQLCFVQTIDWSKIGASLHTLHYNNANLGDCRFCPGHCNGYCWNDNRCQIVQVEECDSQCLGCTKSNPQLCKACSSLYLDKGKCVPQCPESKFLNSETRTCLTAHECFSIISGKWWNFKGECIRKCPERYVKDTREIGLCRYCGDDCYEKICNGAAIDSLWRAEYLRGCTHINGSLKLTVSTAALANNLQVIFGNVKEIDGCLDIHRSHAIASLNFLNNLKVIRGNELCNGPYSLLVYENENLRELWNWNNFTLTIERGKMFFHYNPQLCLSEVDKLLDVAVAAVPLNYTGYEISPFSNGDRTVCRHVDLNIRIIKVESTNATLHWEKLVVETDDEVIGYTFHYIEDPFGDITLGYGRDECFSDEWISKFIIKETGYHIHDLFAYTQYAFYIQVHTLSPASGGLTKMQRFRTLPGDPSPPMNIRVEITTADSIALAWDPPTHPAGIITHYRIVFFLIEDDINFVTQNNYCFQHRSFFDKSQEVDDPLEVWTNSSSCCKKQNWQEWKRVKRSDSPHDLSQQVINVTSTEYEIKNLQYFKIYIVILSACNHLPNCSSSTLIYQRTEPNQDADDIPPGVSVVKNDTSVLVKWLEPPAPNSGILSYLVEYKRTDFKHSANSFQCVTRQDYKNGGYGYTIANLHPGRYSLTVKAVSLAGPGRPSKNVEFEIAVVEPQNSSLAYVMTILILFLVLLASGLLYYYRSKKINWTLLINSNSPEDLDVENQYDLLREDVDVNIPNQEPQGTFGIICNGFIKSQNRPCTVKFTHKYSDRRELSRFLKDVTTMKSFSSYHVVNLLGIVSKEQPALVVMELMAWGDLKSYLRQSKDSATNITPVEMYRMAAEIADGMTYLASKKFVHFDLAARNCMVSAGHTAKIVNFAINKDLYKTDYYKQKNGEAIPVRWMAPESLADGLVTGDSNVWSYGIVLWEIVTLAEQPYEHLSDEEVMRYVIGQKVLELPPNCPELLYEMMVACWRWRSKHRPIFLNLLRQLQSHVRRDFRLVSFYHSREAAKYKKAAKNREYNLPARRIPMLDERPSARWNKQDDEIELCSAQDLSQHQSENLPSTSSHI